LLYRGFPHGDPFVFLSADRRQLYVMKYGDPDVGKLRLAVLDPETLQTISEGDWPPCGHRIQVRSDRWICANIDFSTHAFSLDVVNPSRGIVVETLMTIPNLQVAGLALAADESRLYVFSPDATLTLIDIPKRTILATGRLEVNARWEIVWDSATPSPDGKRLYVGFDTGDDERQVFTDAIGVYDTATWERIASVDLRDTVTHFALSAESDRLYAVSPFDRSLAIYDTSTYQEVTVLADLGGTPAAVIVPPTER